MVMLTLHHYSPIIALLVVAVALPARASTVALDSETVHIRVGPGAVRVESRAVFINQGVACNVRLGYPRTGRVFTLHVDGKAAPPAAGKLNGATCYARQVPFQARQRRTVTSRYTLPLTLHSAIDGAFYQVHYALGAAITWRKPLRRSDITVTFDRPNLPARLALRSREVLAEDHIENLPWSRYHPGTVIFAGPGQPTNRGRTLHWTRTNWMPTTGDDVALCWKE